MRDKFVRKDVSARAKLLGYNWQLMPTQSILQRWFRELHCIHINPRHRPHSQTYCYSLSGKYQDENNGDLLSKVFVKFPTYEEMMDDALDECCRILEEKRVNLS